MNTIFIIAIVWAITIFIGLFIVNFNLAMGLSKSETVEIVDDLAYYFKGKNKIVVESFYPSVLYIEEGDKVKWINKSSSKKHSVTSILSYGKPIFFDHVLYNMTNSNIDEFEYRF